MNLKQLFAAAMARIQSKAIARELETKKSLKIRLLDPGCRPIARHRIRQARYIPSPPNGKRWEHGKLVAVAR